MFNFSFIDWCCLSYLRLGQLRFIAFFQHLSLQVVVVVEDRTSWVKSGREMWVFSSMSCVCYVMSWIIYFMQECRVSKISLIFMTSNNDSFSRLTWGRLTLTRWGRAQWRQGRTGGSRTFFRMPSRPSGWTSPEAAAAMMTATLTVTMTNGIRRCNSQLFSCDFYCFWLALLLFRDWDLDGKT